MPRSIIVLAGTEVWHLSCERYLAQMKSGGSSQRDPSSSPPTVSRDAAVQRNGEGVSMTSGRIAANGDIKKEQQSKTSTVTSKFENSKSLDSPLGKFARSDTCKPLWNGYCVCRLVKSGHTSAVIQGSSVGVPCSVTLSPTYLRTYIIHYHFEWQTFV